MMQVRCNTENLSAAVNARLSELKGHSNENSSENRKAPCLTETRVRFRNDLRHAWEMAGFIDDSAVPVEEAWNIFEKPLRSFADIFLNQDNSDEDPSYSPDSETSDSDSEDEKNSVHDTRQQRRKRNHEEAFSDNHKLAHNKLVDWTLPQPRKGADFSSGTSSSIPEAVDKHSRRPPRKTPTRTYATTSRNNADRKRASRQAMPSAEEFAELKRDVARLQSVLADTIRYVFSMPHGGANLNRSRQAATN